MDFNLEEMSTEEIIQLHSYSKKVLKKRGIIRTNNSIIGDLGEYLAIKYYNETPNLPNLREAEVGTKNIDAISRNGERYSIKSMTINKTGSFRGLEPIDSEKQDEQIFEYVILCRFDDNYELLEILELDWNTFIENKKWHTRNQAWYLNVTKKLKNECKIIYSKTE